MLIPEGYGIAAWKHTLDSTGEVMVCTAGFHNIGSDTAIDNADTLGTVFEGAFDVAYLSDQYTLTSVYVLETIGGVSQAAESAINAAGTRTSAVVSPAVALGVKKQTSYAGKKYRGRMYLPAGWLTEAETSPAGVIDAGWLDPIQGFCDNLLSGMNAAGLPMYLLHTDATTPTPVNALIARDTVKTQRRRQRSS